MPLERARRHFDDAVAPFTKVPLGNTRGGGEFHKTSAAVSQTREVASLPRLLSDQLDLRIHTGKLELPILPEAAALLLSMSKDDDFDPQQLESIVRRDAAMAAHLLRIANSALFAPRIPIVSLRQAIARVGIFEIRKIAMLFTCETRVFRVRGWETEVRKLFVHSLACGLFGQQIAKLAHMNSEEAFLAGLLHDIGAPVLLQALVDLQRETRCAAQRPAVKRAVYDRHARAGSDLARSWSLSTRLVEIIAFHHVPLSSQLTEKSAALVHLADDLSRQLFEDQVEQDQPVASEAVLDTLELTPTDMSTLLAKGRDVLEMTRTMA
jgi:HD-like signal output (HDOD) protein